MIGVALVVAALAAVATGAARASAGTDWCGLAEGLCDTSMTYLECSDGSVWVLDQTWSPEEFGEQACEGGYSVLAPPAFTQQSDEPGNDQMSARDFGLAWNMTPDPANYATEIQCPIGQVWAVAKGEDFVCPAAEGAARATRAAGPSAG